MKGGVAFHFEIGGFQGGVRRGLGAGAGSVSAVRVEVLKCLEAKTPTKRRTREKRG